jgi:hypothetical protein
VQGLPHIQEIKAIRKEGCSVNIHNIILVHIAINGEAAIAWWLES